MAVAEVATRYEYEPALRLPMSKAARRRPSRRACVAVLSAMAAAAVLQIGAAVVVNLWFPEIIDPSYGNRMARLWEGRAADPARTRTVVMVGSSRTYYGLQTGPLSASLSEKLGRPISVVNAAYFGGGPLTELLFWRRLRRENFRPDLLLIEVAPGCLSSPCPPVEMREERLPANHIGWLDLPLLKRYRAGTRPTLCRDVAFTDAGIIYNRRRNILCALAPQLLPAVGASIDEAAGPGFLPADPPLELRQKALKFAHGEYLRLADFSFTGRESGTDALRQLLASCRQWGVPTCLVIMPEGKECRSWYSPSAWPRIQESMEQLRREEGTKLVVAREWIDEDDFLDSHHLLPRGAAKFSERLGREAILPFLIQQEKTSPDSRSYQGRRAMIR